jgi:hypothetical protein
MSCENLAYDKPLSVSQQGQNHGSVPSLPGSSWLFLAPPGSSWLLLAPLGSCWLLLAFGDGVLKAHPSKRRFRRPYDEEENPTKRAAENEKARESRNPKQLQKRMLRPPGNGPKKWGSRYYSQPEH